VAAVNRRFDIFGILVPSFVAGNFGGITCDLLIGAVPPAALADGQYLLVSIMAAHHLLLLCRCKRRSSSACARLMTGDVLLAEIPHVLCSDLCAVAALVGTSIVVIGPSAGSPHDISVLAEAVLCFGLRFMAIRCGWHLPVAHPSARERKKPAQWRSKSSANIHSNGLAPVLDRADTGIRSVEGTKLLMAT